MVPGWFWCSSKPKAAYSWLQPHTGSRCRKQSLTTSACPRLGLGSTLHDWKHIAPPWQEPFTWQALEEEEEGIRGTGAGEPERGAGWEQGPLTFMASASGIPSSSLCQGSRAWHNSGSRGECGRKVELGTRNISDFRAF